MICRLIIIATGVKTDLDHGVTVLSVERVGPPVNGNQCNGNPV